MVGRIVGGVVVLVIGGGSYAVSQSSITKNFSKNSGLSQQQAQQYVNNIPKSDLQSFSKVGQGFVRDGNTVLKDASGFDCVNYTYPWVTPTLSCQDGENQLQTIGSDEITLGNCYQSLDANLGSNATSTINECISDINTASSDYNLPIVTSLLDHKTVTDQENINAYDKSVLQAALQSKQ